MTDKSEQCSAQIWVKGPLVYTGGKNRYDWHYAIKRCSRRATKEGRCWQHPHGHGFTDCKW